MDAATQRWVILILTGAIAFTVVTLNVTFFAVVIFVGDGPRDRLLELISQYFTPAVLGSMVAFVMAHFFATTRSGPPPVPSEPSPPHG